MSKFGEKLARPPPWVPTTSGVLLPRAWSRSGLTKNGGLCVAPLLLPPLDEPEVLLLPPPAIAVPLPPEHCRCRPSYWCFPELLVPPDDDEPLLDDELLVDVLVDVVVVVEVLDAEDRSTAAGFGIANVECLPTVSDWIWKSKSTPMNSKNVSLTVMNRTSTDTRMILQPAKLAEQVGDLVVNFGRVFDDQADAEEEGNDCTGLPLGIDTAGIAAEARRPGRKLTLHPCP